MEWNELGFQQRFSQQLFSIRVTGWRSVPIVVALCFCECLFVCLNEWMSGRERHENQNTYSLNRNAVVYALEHTQRKVGKWIFLSAWSKNRPYILSIVNGRTVNVPIVLFIFYNNTFMAMVFYGILSHVPSIYMTHSIPYHFDVLIRIRFLPYYWYAIASSPGILHYNWFTSAKNTYNFQFTHIFAIRKTCNAEKKKVGMRGLAADWINWSAHEHKINNRVVSCVCVCVCQHSISGWK